MPFLWIQLTLVTMYFKPNVTKLQEVCMLKRCSELYCDTCMKFTLISQYCNLYSFTIMKWRDRLKPTHFSLFCVVFIFTWAIRQHLAVCALLAVQPVHSVASSDGFVCRSSASYRTASQGQFKSYRSTRLVQFIKFTNSQRGFAGTVHLMQNLAARTS